MVVFCINIVDKTRKYWYNFFKMSTFINPLNRANLNISINLKEKKCHYSVKKYALVVVNKQAYSTP